MTKGIKRNALSWLRAKAADEEGSSVIPFIMYVPLFMILVVSSVEFGLYALRYVMLDRAVDMTVREIRLGLWRGATHDQIKNDICENTPVIPHCKDVVLVEMQTISKTTYGPLPATNAVCVDRDADVQPMTTFHGGNPEDLMLIRVCALADPFFPTTGLGSYIRKDSTGAYALVVASIFVDEPT
ncbi:MAG: TadE family protein [Paracoccaceae bacterium]